MLTTKNITGVFIFGAGLRLRRRRSAEDMEIRKRTKRGTWAAQPTLSLNATMSWSC